MLSKLLSQLSLGEGKVLPGQPIAGPSLMAEAAMQGSNP